MDFRMSTVTTYTQHSRYLTGYKGAPFKPSAKKGHKEVEFAPTNLHMQRMWVASSSSGPSGCYDHTTVGAFTAYAQKYKHGGLRRLLHQLQDVTGSCGSRSSQEGQQNWNHLQSITKSLDTIQQLRRIVVQCCEKVCRDSLQSHPDALSASMTVLADKTRQLISVCEDTLIEEGIEEFARAKKGLGTENPPRPLSDIFSKGMASSSTEQLSLQQVWKWSGTDFVKSPTQEPWELTRLNTEAAVVCVMSKVEELVGCGLSDSVKWLEELSPLMIKLQQCVEVMCGRASYGLTFLTIEESSQNVALMHAVKYRRDVVFSQTLTSAMSAIMSCLRAFGSDEVFMQQAMQMGILLQFESLLSCHGDEMGMVEDMVVGVSDLSHVTVRLQQAVGLDDASPLVTGCRGSYEVVAPVPAAVFNLLPQELQQGRLIHLVPVLFSIGINEVATVAERIGDTSLQEAVNEENYHKLHQYCNKYMELFADKESTTHSSTLEQLMRRLHINVMSKKNKNTEVLSLAAEVCREVCGLRFTSCKSGKDRTAMSVTLEQVQLLQRHHDLASHIFIHALDCMRSEGVRRENTAKNVGSRKYAFNSIQLLSIPKLYRPPSGTYGNIQT